MERRSYQLSNNEAARSVCTIPPFPRYPIKTVMSTALTKSSCGKVHSKCRYIDHTRWKLDGLSRGLFRVYPASRNGALRERGKSDIPGGRARCRDLMSVHPIAIYERGAATIGSAVVLGLARPVVVRRRPGDRFRPYRLSRAISPGV